MKDASPAAPLEIFLKDYTPPSHLVDTVELTFKLHPTQTRVISKIAFRPNPQAKDKTFYLHGEQLELIWARIDGHDAQAKLTDLGLTAQVPDAPFLFEAEVEISPETNTALEGLYMSNGMYCTQCEAEGFRKITYYPDRPDVMGVFTVTIEGAEKVKLSNGNDLGDGRWHDPHPKPAYLFALVAGDLVNLADTFTTKSGRQVDLNIWVRDGDLHKTAFGMDALKRSMTWDEEVYGREYDLDLFNIVAVDDFNMGAMENKGLNIFNSSAVLASPETSTDGNFARIETIIAHEYFHNWTGNRITCRDWFQLCLKEGLTVFRDQQFSGDTRGHAVERINDVMMLRARQFREDNGPLAHPVRPESFVEINNFYTATVYEKGAEVIGMLKTLIGEAKYYEGCDLYFTRHDGQACTIEDWLACFEEVTGRDLTQFKLWYSQAGTPRVEIRTEVTGKAGPVIKDGEEITPISWKVVARQHTPPTPGQTDKIPFLIPIKLGLFDHNGNLENAGLEDRVFELDCEEKVIATGSYLAHDRPPIVSAFRGFCAPVIVEQDLTNAERAILLAHDTDPFNKWEAGRALGRDVMVRMVSEDATPDQAYLDALVAVARDDSLAPDFKALCFSGPSNDDIQQALVDAGLVPDPTKIFLAGQTFNMAIAQAMQDLLPRIYAEMQVDGPYRPVAEDMGKRDWGNAALAMLSRLDGGAQASRQFESADNMTQQLAALGCLLRQEVGERENAAFYEQWQSDRLVMDKWFSMQVAHAKLDRAAQKAQEMAAHPDFTMTNPNRFRAVYGALGANAAGFHDPSGDGYRVMSDALIALDPLNPQTTARMSSVFETWRRYDADRQDQMREALEKIKAAPDLSRDTTEMVTRILNG